MNFRQRMSWIFLLIFLGISCLIAYYIFELSDQYDDLALVHVQTYHDTLRLNPHQLTWYMSITRRMVELPFWFWVFVIGLPYFQIFLVLIACTRSDPLNATVMVVPLFLCMKIINMGTKPEEPRYTVVEDHAHAQST